MNNQGIRIEKDGFHRYRWNGHTQKHERCHVSSIFACLREYCEIAEGVTLGDIFKAVDAYPALKKFMARYSWCRKIDAFHQQAHLPMLVDEDDKEDDKEEPLDHLRIYWHVSNDCYKKITYFDKTPSFDGVGVNGTAFSVSYSPMYKLAHLPVKIDTSLTIERDFKNRKEDGGNIIYHAQKACFSLLEVLDAIYDDISFMGGPEENEKFAQEMREQVEEIKKDLEAGPLDPEKYVPMEELFKDLKDDEEPRQDASLN